MTVTNLDNRWGNFGNTHQQMTLLKQHISFKLNTKQNVGTIYIAGFPSMCTTFINTSKYNHKSRTKCHSWWRTEQAGSRQDSWVARRCLERTAYGALAGVCFFSCRAWPSSGAVKVASEMTSFTSRFRMRAHPAGGVAEDASARTMTAGLAFPIMYPLLAALQACTDINASTTLRHDSGNQQRIS